MSIFSTAKSVISIGTTGAAATLVGLQADTYTPIGEVEDLDSIGVEFEELKFASVSDGFIRRRKGVADGGLLELTVARDPGDAGQNALRAAAKADNQAPYSFKIELSDKPASGSSPKNSLFLFKAVVLSARNELGDANTIAKTIFRLGTTGEPFEIMASAS